MKEDQHLDEKYKFNDAMEQDSELSVPELIAIIKEYVRYLLKKKWWIMLFFGIVVAFSVTFELLKKPLYTANYRFLVTENEGGGGSVSAILGQFGMMGVDNGGSVNQGRLLLIGKSYPILSQLILEDAFFEGDSNKLASHIIRTQNLDTSWITIIDEGPRINSPIDTTTLTYNEVMKSLVSYIVKTEDPAFFDLSIDKKTNVLKIAFSSNSAELSWILATRLYDLLSNHYVEKTTGSQKYNYELLTHKKDSIYELLVSAEQNFAKTTDRSRGFVLAQDRVPSLENRRKIEIYSQMYSELLTRQQTAEFMLFTSTPIFQVLDYPLLPLSNSNQIMPLNIIIFGIVGFIFFSLVFIALKFLQDNFGKHLE
ncbi:Wzz/FepE/Etk N-terminal domain-containing protein [Bacteroidia bacterium]|nr:Wzz/FepE/Etk N-terminal domain-containing protein [Bacteroidia bacterium]